MSSKVLAHEPEGWSAMSKSYWATAGDGGSAVSVEVAKGFLAAKVSVWIPTHGLSITLRWLALCVQR